MSNLSEVCCRTAAALDDTALRGAVTSIATSSQPHFLHVAVQCVWQCGVCVAVRCVWQYGVGDSAMYVAVQCMWRCNVCGGAMYVAVQCMWQCVVVTNSFALIH